MGEEQTQAMPNLDTVVNYKCPNCDAPLGFDIQNQQWDCHFCGSSFDQSRISELEEQKGTSQSEGWQSEEEAFEEGQTVVYTCPSCGGSVLTEPNTAATFCAFCHNPTVIASKLSGENQPVSLIPFKKSREAAVEAFQKACRHKPLLPHAFKEAAEKGELTGLYVPYWLFSADYDAFLYATGENATVWRDSRYEYTKIDTYYVERGAQIPLHKVPVDASSKLDDKLMEAMEPYDYNDLEDFSMQYLSGHFAESYDVDSEECGKRFTQRAQGAVDSTMRGMAAGYHTLKVHSIQRTSRNHMTEYVMLPVWTFITKLGNKTYFYTMNGQTGKIGGKLPTAWGSAAKWFGIAAGAAAAATWLGGFLL